MYMYICRNRSYVYLYVWMCEYAYNWHIYDNMSHTRPSGMHRIYMRHTRCRHTFKPSWYIFIDIFVYTPYYWISTSKSRVYGVATIRRLLEIIRLFCKRALSKRQYSAKETCNCVPAVLLNTYVEKSCVCDGYTHKNPCNYTSLCKRAL